VALFLRKLNNHSVWIQEPGELPWLDFGKDVPADLLNDLKTTGNKLSVYEVYEDQSNLSRILSALASTRDSLNKIDFAVFDQGVCENLKIQKSQVHGRTPRF